MISSAHYEEEKKKERISSVGLIVHTVMRHFATCPADPPKIGNEIKKDKAKGIKGKAGDAISVGSNAT